MSKEESKEKSQNATLKKNAMLKALESTLGVVTSACEVVGIDRRTHYRWMNEDEAYRVQVESLTDLAVDFAESQLFELIKGAHREVSTPDGEVIRIQDAPNTSATIFYLKTRGKKRGYVERTELAGVNDAPIQIIINDKL
jgi:hypothetical protein